ncbi:MAG: hypothetical protein DWQ01_05760 [Planctomycetota bacterium]|nr:MAG: hypothetical protein DWQ01_05760 [Planctomycetota bacterium]
MNTLAWISSGEIFVAILIGLLLFGGRLPDVAKDIGKAFFRLRRTLDELRRETGLDDTLAELRRDSQVVTKPFQEIQGEVRRSQQLELGPDPEDLYPTDPSNSPAEEVDEEDQNQTVDEVEQVQDPEDGEEQEKPSDFV